MSIASPDAFKPYRKPLLSKKAPSGCDDSAGKRDIPGGPANWRTTETRSGLSERAMEDAKIKRGPPYKRSTTRPEFES